MRDHAVSNNNMLQILSKTWAI